MKPLHLAPTDPLFLSLFHMHSFQYCPIMSNLKSLPYPFMCSRAPSDQAGILCLTNYLCIPQKGQGNARLSACLQRIPTPASQGSRPASQLINVLLPSVNLNQGIQDKAARAWLPKSLHLLRKMPGCIKLQLLHELNGNSQSNTIKSRRCWKRGELHTYSRRDESRAEVPLHPLTS